MDVVMPDLGGTPEAIVSRWLRRPGDAVHAGEILLEVETDKSSIEVPAPASGILNRVVVEEGVAVPGGATLGVITEA